MKRAQTRIVLTALIVTGFLLAMNWWESQRKASADKGSDSVSSMVRSLGQAG